MDSTESKVVRIVNLHKHVNEEWLRNIIQQRVRLIGHIKKIYIKKYINENIIFAYVVFEESVDASRTVEALDETIHEHVEWDVARIEPFERYVRYLDIQILSDDEDEHVNLEGRRYLRDPEANRETRRDDRRRHQRERRREINDFLLEL